jgi:hypothetical protein
MLARHWPHEKKQFYITKNHLCSWTYVALNMRELNTTWQNLPNHPPYYVLFDRNILKSLVAAPCSGQRCPWLYIPSRDLYLGFKRKCIFQFSRKCKNHAIMGRLSRNFVLWKFLFMQKFSRKSHKNFAKTKNPLKLTLTRHACGVNFCHNISF